MNPTATERSEHLTALVERVESGSDRELDFDILIAFGWRDERKYGFLADLGGEHYWIGSPDCWNGEPPFVTSSLDDAISLAERVLPEITDNSAADFLAGAIEEMMQRGWRPSDPNVPQIARAVIAALLRALQSKDTPNG